MERETGWRIRSGNRNMRVKNDEWKEKQDGE
jgi:hypothetical protein